MSKSCNDGLSIKIRGNPQTVIIYDHLLFFLFGVPTQWAKSLTAQGVINPDFTLYPRLLRYSNFMGRNSNFDRKLTQNIFTRSSESKFSEHTYYSTKNTENTKSHRFQQLHRYGNRSPDQKKVQWPPLGVREKV